MAFEPSPIWLDDSSMAVDEASKVFLRNVLGKSKSQLRELNQDVDKKRREFDNVKRVRQRVKEGKDNHDEVEVVRSLFYLQDELHQVERKRLTSVVETQTITSVVGDLSIGAQNHNFRPQTFKIPTNCDLCGERIWGLSAKGFDCRDCGYTCHSKCELKVPPDCPGEQSKDERKKLKSDRQQAANAAHPAPNGSHVDGAHDSLDLSRSNTMTSLSSGYAASANRSVSGTRPRTPDEDNGPDRSAPLPAENKPPVARRNRIVAPPPAQYVSEPPRSNPSAGESTPSHPSEPQGMMLYAYEANGDGEVSVDEGQSVTIIEPDGRRLPRSPITAPTDFQRWLGLDERSAWILQLWPGTSKLRRNATYQRCNPVAASSIGVFKLVDIVNWEHDFAREEERTSSSTETRSQKAQIRRSIVRLRVPKRC